MLYVCATVKRYKKDNMKNEIEEIVKAKLLAFIEHIKKHNELTETVNANDVKAFLTELQRTEMDETFYEGEIISYDYNFTAKVVKVHGGGGLLDIILYHAKAGVVSTKPTSVPASLCIKFKQL
jgi:hypothetical protein